MPAHARSRAQDFHARVAVCQADGFPYIYAKPVGQARKLVGNCDIHIAVSIFHQFDHFRGCGVGLHDLALHKNGIKVAGGLRRSRGDAADHAGIFDQLAQNLAWQHAFR